ncbi:MAG: FHA domain-containing protein [Vulcanimicrobiaceae bacterium]
MTFAAQMRLGSLEMLAALVIFAVLAGRMRSRQFEEGSGFEPLRIELEIRELGTNRRVEGPLPLVVGRSTQAGIALTDPEVSRRHARFDAERGVIYVTDLQSSNGTFLNGERVTESIEVRPGDHIDVGSTRMTFVGSPALWK